jgi:nickel superoxide dismutase
MFSITALLRFFSHILNKVYKPSIVYAHCDIPCGIYTTRQASIAAETVEKMVQKIEELRKSDKPELEKEHELARLVATKEEWAQICKQELWILWSDYFKPEHLQKYPDLHDIFWKATKLCSQNKREVNGAAARQLRELVDGKITQIFKEAEEAKGERPRI